MSVPSGDTTTDAARLQIGHADVIRIALAYLSDDLTHWGEPGATYDAEAIPDALPPDATT